MYQFETATVKKIINAYYHATLSKVYVYDHNYRLVPEFSEKNGVKQKVCRYCPKYQTESSGDENEFCQKMHMNAIKESSRCGGTSPYICDMGLAFWSSPIFSEGRFAGALSGSGYVLSGSLPEEGQIPEAFMKKLKQLPREDWEKIKSLAEMLLMCAASLSRGSEKYHEILRRRNIQQNDISAKMKNINKNNTNKTLPEYPLEKEQQLMAALRRGDTTAAMDSLNDILAVLLLSNSEQFRNIQLRAMELAVLLSRLDINSGQNGNLVLKIKNRYLKRIKEAGNFEELTDTMHTMVKRIGGTIASFQGIPHAAAMKKAEEYIKENFSRKITLKEISSISGLSPPYFCKIFKEEIGENFSRYINRLRVEKAGRMLLETNLTLSDIADACCLNDQSWFSKIFRSYTGISPGKYRSQGGSMVQEISENNISWDAIEKLR